MQIMMQIARQTFMRWSKIGGSQFSVREGSELEVDYFGAEPGSEHQWDKVLMLKSSSLTLGQPYVPGAEVHFEVMAQSRQPKILVFKKKRRKGYKRLKGHKQPVTQVRVKRIIAPTS